MIPADSALLVIDVQRGLDDPTYGRRSTPEAEANIARLLAAWRAAGWPVVHVQHLSTRPGSPLRPDRPGAEIKPEAAPLGGEPLFQKHVNNAFLGTGLEASLRQRGTASLVVVGLTTDHCVSTSARMAGDLGFETFVVADATAAFELTGHDGRRFSADDVHAVFLVTLKDEFATIVSTAEVLAALPAAALPRARSAALSEGDRQRLAVRGRLTRGPARTGSTGARRRRSSPGRGPSRPPSRRAA